MSPTAHVYGCAPDGAALAVPVIPSKTTTIAAPSRIRDLILAPLSVL
jgi:hypothetical protein